MKKTPIASGALIASCLMITAVAQNSVGGVEAKVAEDLARERLARELNLEAGEIEVVSSAQRTWSDSGLGCEKPGMQSLQVMTPGYEIVLKSGKGTYRVHATQKYAVLCAAATEWRNPRTVGLPLRNIQAQLDAARADLAAKLNAPVSEIRTQNFLAVDWPDSSMNCAVDGEEVVKQPTKGYRLALRYRGRIYTYHTDLDRVRPCPAIESQ